MERGGYSTFVTLTFTDEQRDKINSGQVTIQKEVTRVLDGFKKVYERGMPKEDIRGQIYLTTTTLTNVFLSLELAQRIDRA